MSKSVVATLRSSFDRYYLGCLQVFHSVGLPVHMYFDTFLLSHFGGHSTVFAIRSRIQVRIASLGSTARFPEEDVLV